MSIKVILVCKEGASRQAYLNEAKKIGVEVDAVSTFGELFQAMITNPYQGVMIDLITSMKASREEKGVAQEILDVFPLIQLKLENETGTIRTISFGSSSGNGSLVDFVNNECRIFTPRTIRLSVRKSINFNVVMSKEEHMNEKLLERTVTMNAFQGGCFLFSSQDWLSTSNVWFIINELQDKSPIKGDVRWAVSWGKNMAIPGIGISFNKIKPEQLEELTNKYSLY
jgi:hypothetical protein